jgi:hypothetical protein
LCQKNRKSNQNNRRRSSGAPAIGFDGLARARQTLGMDWLVPLVVVLGLAALAGIVWLHIETRTPGNRASSNPATAFERSGLGDDQAELSITLRYLRRQAVYFRDLADRVADPVNGARYWDIAGALDKAANALEAHQPANEPPPSDSPDERA